MTDVINKIVSVVLIFILLVICPLVNSYMTDEYLARRVILNTVTEFLDKVSDTGTISESELNTLYLECNGEYLSVNVTVNKVVRLPYLNEAGEEEYTYVTYDIMDSGLNKGDIVRVTVEEVGISSIRRLKFNLLKIDDGPFKFTLSRMVG